MNIRLRETGVGVQGLNQNNSIRMVSR